MEGQTKSAQLPSASAAMVELKAELSRKKEEFRREKASNVNVVKGKKHQKVSLKKKADVWDQKNAGVSARAQKDIEQKESEEDEDALLKSKLILERKCKIYDAISSTGDIPEEDGSEGYLVDFQKKVVDALVEQREMERKEEQEKKEEEAERKALAEPIPEAENSEEEWVDYTDSFGRSRRCMRKDLKDLRKKDQDLTISTGQGKSRQKEMVHGKDTEPQHLMSDDMYREKMRQKWEDEARQLVEKGQEEIHYANVQFDEIRTHGVGFYQFSKDQEEREAQMDKLNKLRDETKTERSRTETIKDKRKAMMEARLAKVRERRKLKTKETPSAADEDAETGSETSVADIEEKKKAEEMKRVKEEAEKAAEETRKKFIREWDKKKVAIQGSWKGDGYVESRRQEREAQFAPPSMYFKNDNPSPKTSSNKSDFWNRKVAYNQNKTFPQSYHVRNNNENNDDGKRFYESSDPQVSESSDPQVSESSDAKSAMQPSKVSATDSRPAPSADVLPIHSIPLPSDVKSISESSDVSSHIPTSHHIYNETVHQPGDKGYSICQPQFHGNSAGVMQGLGLSSNQGPSEYISTTQQQVSWSQQHQISMPQQHQICWSQQSSLPQQCHVSSPEQQPSLPQQHVSWPQQQWPQHQFFPHQPTQPQVAEHVAYANPNQAAADISHCPPRIHGDSIGVKRSSALGMDIETSTSNVPKKPKVPKSAILDNRFMLNSEASQPSGINASTTETCPLPTVQAVQYKPGSFTDAKFKHEASQSDEEFVPSTRGKTSISGGPMLYTKEQRQQQLLKIEENEGSDNKVNDKVEEFLKSVRNEMT